MRQPQLAPKNTVERFVQEASLARQKRDLPRCADMLKRASRKAPKDFGILLLLGETYGLLYDYKSAEETFEKACQLAPEDRKAEILTAAAAHAQRFFKTDIADRLFKRSAQQDGVTPEMLTSGAEFCERARNLEEANALVDRALQMDSGSEAALLMRARLHRNEGSLELAESALGGLLKQTTSEEMRIRAGSELGAVLDRQGRYEEAMAAFVQAKDLLRPSAEAQIGPRQFLREQLAQMRSQISPEILKRWFELRDQLQPHRRIALLGGHPRSGTTLLEQVLDSHNEIVSIEETSHFSDYAQAPLGRRWPTGTPILTMLDGTSNELLDAYRSRYFRAAEQCLGNKIGDRLLIDKNPALTVRIPAMARVFPEIKFLVMIRDPRDVVLSCFLQPVLSVRSVNYPYLSLKTTAEGYAGLMQTWRTVSAMLPNPQQEIRYEDLIEDLPAEARRVLEFLDVPWDDAVLKFDEHAQSKVVRSPSYADVTQKLFKRSQGRWRNYQKYLEPHLHILEPFVKELGYE